MQYILSKQVVLCHGEEYDIFQKSKYCKLNKLVVSDNSTFYISDGYAIRTFPIYRYTRYSSINSNSVKIILLNWLFSRLNIVGKKKTSSIRATCWYICKLLLF